MRPKVLALRDLARLHFVHGDIKPENFLVAPSGRVLLSDFGLAMRPSRALPPGTDFTQWRASPGGTPGYMAPEAWVHCSHGTDVYSAGLVVLELITGRFHPVYDVLVVPDTWQEGADAWYAMTWPERHEWLATYHVDLDDLYVEMAANGVDEKAWDLCMMVRLHAGVVIASTSAETIVPVDAAPASCLGADGPPVLRRARLRSR